MYTNYYTILLILKFSGRGCDESQVHQIAYGTAKRLMKGAVYQFQCDESAVMVGSPMVYCDGRKWNDTVPTCLSKQFQDY